MFKKCYMWYKVVICYVICMELKDKLNMMLFENRFLIGLLGEKEIRGSGCIESGMFLILG